MRTTRWEGTLTALSSIAHGGETRGDDQEGEVGHARHEGKQHAEARDDEERLPLPEELRADVAAER